MTAAVRGPGLELLGELADLTLDSWLDQPSLRIYNAEQLAERMAAEGASIAIVESDRCAGPLFELDLLAVCSCRGDPNNVDVEAATEAGVPVLRAPGRNADAVAELTVGLLFAATRGIVAADDDVRRGEIYKDGTIPYQRFRAWELAGRTAGLVGLGAVGRAAKWRLRRPRHGGHRLRPLRGRADRLLGRAPRARRRRLDARTGHRGDDRDDRRDRSSRPCATAWSSSTRRGRRSTTPTRWSTRSGSGKVSAAGLDHFEGEFLATDHPLTGFDSVVLTPHIGGATYDTETNHTATIAEDLCRLLAGAKPLHVVNPDVLGRR